METIKTALRCWLQRKGNRRQSVASGASKVDPIWKWLRCTEAFDKWRQSIRCEIALKRFRNTGVGRGWRRWANVYHRHRLSMLAIQRSVSHMLNKSLANAWNQWFTLLMLKRPMQVAHRLVDRERSRAFWTWRGYWEERTRADTALRRGLSRMMQQDVPRAWASWSEAAEQLSESMRLLRHAVSFLTKRELKAGMAAWRDASAGHSAMAGAMSHFLNRSLATGWVTWRCYWDELRHMRTCLRRGISRLMSRQLSASWAKWCEAAAALLSTMRLLRHAAARLTRRRRSSR